MSAARRVRARGAPPECYFDRARPIDAGKITIANVAERD